MATPLNVLLVDDHLIFRQSVAQTLSAAASVHVFHCASTAEAFRIIESVAIDIALVDYDLGAETALAFTAESRTAGFTGPILIVTAGLTIAQARILLMAGVQGIFIKDQSLESLAETIATLHRGERCVDPRYFAALDGNADNAEPDLTRRETEMLAGVLEGLANKEIAANLKVSESTVKGGVQRLFDKFGVHTRSQLVRAVLERSEYPR